MTLEPFDEIKNDINVGDVLIGNSGSHWKVTRVYRDVITPTHVDIENIEPVGTWWSIGDKKEHYNINNGFTHRINNVIDN